MIIDYSSLPYLHVSERHLFFSFRLFIVRERSISLFFNPSFGSRIVRSVKKYSFKKIDHSVKTIVLKKFPKKIVRLGERTIYFILVSTYLSLGSLYSLSMCLSIFLTCYILSNIFIKSLIIVIYLSILQG